MNVVWHQTSHIHSRVLAPDPKHELGEWEVYAPGWKGLGVVTVARGASATPPPEIMAICRVKNVWRVIADEQQGYFIITVSNDRVWTVTEGEIIQAYVQAKEKVDAQLPPQKEEDRGA
jgi:hypothetical protein